MKLWYLIVFSVSQAISLSLFSVSRSDCLDRDFKEIFYLVGIVNLEGWRPSQVIFYLCDYLLLHKINTHCNYSHTKEDVDSSKNKLCICLESAMTNLPILNLISILRECKSESQIQVFAWSTLRIIQNFHPNLWFRYTLVNVINIGSSRYKISKSNCHQAYKAEICPIKVRPILTMICTNVL